MAIFASLSLLPRADGSAAFECGATRIIASVSGPMEVRPRDELPDKAFIEVIVRPAIGVGGILPLSPSPSCVLARANVGKGTRERVLESRVLAALSPLIVAGHHPRTLVQINIQIVEAVDHTDATALLPACLNAATLALVDAGIPLTSVLVATTVADGVGSKHVLAFTKAGRCVFAQSSGRFNEAGLLRAVEEGRVRCALLDAGGDMADTGSGETVGVVMRRAIERKVLGDMRWRQ